MKKAVLTIPASFNNQQKEEIKSASDFAGFECNYMIEEPVAAAITHYSEKEGNFNS